MPRPLLHSASRSERAQFRVTVPSAVVAAVLLVSAGCGGGTATSSRATVHRASPAAAQAKQQAGLDTYLNDDLRPLLLRQFQEMRPVLLAIGAYSRNPTPADARVASRAVERME